METTSKNHGSLNVILLLMQSVGDIFQRNGLQADKPTDNRETSETGQYYRKGKVYVKATSPHFLIYTPTGTKPD